MQSTNKVGSKIIHLQVSKAFKNTSAKEIELGK